jgi:hypothetical protein
MLCVICMLLAGCSSLSPGLSTSTLHASPSPTGHAYGATLNLATAWGAITIQRLPTAVDDKHVFVFENAATPDGGWLLGAIEPRNFINNSTELSVVALYNIATHQIQRIRLLLHPQSQIIGATVDDHWIVWSEAPDQPNFFDWTLFAYNRQTGAVRQLAR